jgi:carboxypeptidase PM20D1
MSWVAGVIAAAALLLCILIVRAVRFKRTVTSESPDSSLLPVSHQAAEHLQEAVRFRTVSHADPETVDWEEFRRFKQWLSSAYPLVHSRLELTEINEFTLIYRWGGTDARLDPILLIAHQDVVPAGDEKQWAYPPFAGISAQGYIWGRGTLDIKVQLIAVLEAAEHLLRKNYTPKRGIYICFGHDEEVGGHNGAAQAAAYFAREGIRFSFLLDEGGAVADNMVAGLSLPFAAVGIAEKGYLDVEISCTSRGGHASTPPARTALGLAARAAARLEQKKFPLRLTEVPRAMFRSLGPHMPWHYRLIIANLRFFQPLFVRILAGGAAGSAMVRTTAAPTTARGSDAPNVLPASAAITFNVRLLTGTSSEQALRRIRRVVESRRGPVSVQPLLVNEPSHVSPIDSSQFSLLTRSIRQIFPGCVTAPYLMFGGTDSMKYQDVCTHIYRFSPYHIDAAEFDTIHAVNERISLENVDASVRFLVQLIDNLQKYL